MVRMALIGCGANAAPYLAAAQQFPEAAITAVADDDAAQVDRAARTAGAAVRGGSLDELLASAAETFEAVIITSPPETHAALVQRAAQAGKHALVEPPLAPTAGEAQQIAAAARAAGVRLMLAHPARFQADHRAVKDSLDDGELGRPGLLRIHQWFSATDGSERAAHASLAALDLALWMFAGLPTHVYAVARPAQTTGLAAGGVRASPPRLCPAAVLALIDLAHTLPTGDGVRLADADRLARRRLRRHAPQRTATLRRRAIPKRCGRSRTNRWSRWCWRSLPQPSRSSGSRPVGGAGRARCAAGRRRRGVVVGRGESHDADGGPL